MCDNLQRTILSVQSYIAPVSISNASYMPPEFRHASLSYEIVVPQAAPAPVVEPEPVVADPGLRAMSTWSVGEVLFWLDTNEFDCTDIVKDNNIDGAKLMQITDEEMKELGIRIKTRKRLREEIEKRK